MNWFLHNWDILLIGFMFLLMLILLLRMGNDYFKKDKPDDKT
jgi:hypothetical protein